MRNKALLFVSVISLVFSGITSAASLTIHPSKSSPIHWFYPAPVDDSDYPDFVIDAHGIYNLEITVDKTIKNKPSCAAKIEGCVLGTFVIQPGEKAICQPTELDVFVSPVCDPTTENAGAIAGTVRFFKK